MTRLITGDALRELRKLPAASFDGCLTDPPYGLAEKQSYLRASSRDKVASSGFMGLAWDGTTPGTEVWAEVLRVLKPGAPMLAFGGTRTYHRLVCAIEDAGFIVADTLCWLYGQGFPKGHAQLKPAWEPITLAWKKGRRKLNIDKSMIGEGKRWPANVLLDEISGAALDLQTGKLTSGNNPAVRHSPKTRDIYGLGFGDQCLVRRPTDSGGASRFFYCAKASRSERGEGNTHPTVKPLKLLEYLARLILPPEPGTPRRLLVPFSGSGSELLAAKLAGWDQTVGIEINGAYVAMARARLALEAPGRKAG
jgi:site-specific DNA-methyltransferase (adenine-specific)